MCWSTLCLYMGTWPKIWLELGHMTAWERTAHLGFPIGHHSEESDGSTWVDIFNPTFFNDGENLPNFVKLHELNG